MNFDLNEKKKMSRILSFYSHLFKTKKTSYYFLNNFQSSFKNLTQNNPLIIFVAGDFDSKFNSQALHCEKLIFYFHSWYFINS